MKKGWIAHWIDDDTGERLSDHVGYAKSDARRALSKHIDPNTWNMRARYARPGETPDFVLTKAGESVGLMID